MWQMPNVNVGDRVLFYDNPFSSDNAQLGFVLSSPGASTTSILVFTRSGFVEKLSVRHADDPFWKESETAQQWQIWGCWRIHPEVEAIREIQDLLQKRSQKRDSIAA